MSTVNMVALIPGLKGAIDRHGAYVADLVEQYDAPEIAWRASEFAALGYSRVEGSKPDNIEGADNFEKAAMMYLVAAKKLRKDAGQ